MSHARTPRPAAAAIALSTLCLTASVGLAQSYTITDLGTLGGPTAALDINDAGVIVGYSRRAGTEFNPGAERPVKWTNGALTEIDPNGWWGSGRAERINGNGFISGKTQTALNCFPQGKQLWAPGNNPMFFGNLGTHQTEFLGITSTNAPIGRAMMASGSTAAVRYQSAAAQLIGQMPGAQGLFEAAAMDASPAGLIVGFTTQFEPGIQHAFVAQGAVVTDLGTLPDRTHTAARSINAAGLVVGEAHDGGNPCTPGGRQISPLAVAWTPASGGQRVAQLLPSRDGWFASGAIDLNDRGEIVGFGDGGLGEKTVVWRGGGGGGGEMYTLDERTPGAAGQGWENLTATAINNRGQIVGSGYRVIRPGQWGPVIESRAFVATPCWGNFDGAAGTTIDDLFGFLSSYFRAEAKADVDRGGSVDTNDVFAFLGSWFTGCP